jgi:hypothetical protein
VNPNARLNFHDDLTVGGLGIGSLDFDHRINAGAAFWQLIGTHAVPRYWKFD